MKLQIRKMQLEVWETENRLKVEHCDLTSDIVSVGGNSDVMSQPEDSGVLIVNNGEYAINDEGNIIVLQQNYKA